MTGRNTNRKSALTITRFVRHFFEVSIEITLQMSNGHIKDIKQKSVTSETAIRSNDDGDAGLHHSLASGGQKLKFFRAPPIKGGGATSNTEQNSRSFLKIKTGYTIC